MRLISRHILRTLSAPFFWGVAALTGLLLLNSLPPLIERFGGKGLPASLMVEGVLLFLPALLALTLPMAVLVSTLYGYSQLAASLEMVAMYANGISVWRMARPALLGAAAIAVINFFVFDQLVPRSNVRFSDLQTAVMNKSPTLALQQQVLNVLPSPSGYVLRAQSIDPVTGGMRGVTIFDMSQTGSRRLIVADSGSMAESANGTDLILLLHNGETYEFTRNEPGQLQQTRFLHDRVVVRNVQNQLQLSNARTSRGEREKSSCELLDGIAERKWAVGNLTRESESYTRRDLRAMNGLPPLLAPPVQVEPTLPPHCGAYRKFERWFSKLMLPQQLGAQAPQQPVVQQPVVQQPVVKQPAPQQPVQQQPPAAALTPPVVQPPVQQFLVPPRSQTDMMSGFQLVNYTDLRLNDAKETMRKYQVEYHQKFAVPLSSFCFVLIGIALALKYPASGIGLVIGGSLVIFLGFYIMLQGGKGVASAGHLYPAVALYAPLVLFTAVGLFALESADREMGTARSTGVFAAIADFFRRGEG